MATANAIRGFQGEHRFLSNFWPCQLTGRNGLKYATVEHAFQACKFPDGSDAHEAARTAPTPGEAKKLGRNGRQRSDWNMVRVGVMHRLLKLKFAPGTALATRLLDTGDAELIEDNTWGDRFWGVCDGRGENTLGKLLMEVRAELRGSGS